MKVSRKVARRSHRSRYSSVSRRRLRNKKSRSGYKKKHAKTQRGGARSRKYGHKRGKRFHRGGIKLDKECYTELTSSLAGYDSEKGVPLKYKKNVFGYTDDTKLFKVQVYGSSRNSNDKCLSSAGKIVLVRQTSNPVTITMEFLYHGDIDTMKKILSSGVCEEGGNKVVNYSVNYTENNDFFKKVFNAIYQNYNKIKANKKAADEIKKQEQQIEDVEGWEKHQKQLKDQKILEKKAGDTFTDMGDEAEVTLHYTQTIPYVDSSEEIKEIQVNFSDFKKELQTLAETTIQKINELEIPTEQKLVRIDRVDEKLISEFRAHLDIMKENYIAKQLNYDITKSITGKWSLLDLTSRRVNDNEEAKKQIMALGLEYEPPTDPDWHNNYSSSSPYRNPGLVYTNPPSSTLVPGQQWDQMGFPSDPRYVGFRSDPPVE